MLDLDTFLTTLHVLVDDSIKSQPAKPARPGQQAHLTDSEVVTLALAAQWKQFTSERAFVRYAVKNLRSAFPRLPDRSQLNRLIRDAHERIVGVGQDFVSLLGSAHQPYEVLDGMGVAVRNTKRIGPGWLSGRANTGWSNRLGWYDGFHVLTAVDRIGVVTGYAIAPASTKDSRMRRTFWRRVRSHMSACRWWDGGQAEHTWAIAAMRDASGINAGMWSLAQKCWHHRAMTANALGRKTGGGSMRGCARLSKRCMENGPRPFARMMSVRIPWKAFWRAWRP
jgi:hypothetical protein